MRAVLSELQRAHNDIREQGIAAEHLPSSWMPSIDACEGQLQIAT